VVPLDAERGEEKPKAVAVIDEQACIGCTLCIQACPVDAILGAAKSMHTVIADECTGCELCLPPCPVDCIHMQPLGVDIDNWKIEPESIAEQLSKRASFRRTMKQYCESAMNAGAKGVKIICAGRLAGSEMARKETQKLGSIPLHTLDADVDYAVATSRTTYGTIGVKVWIYKGKFGEELERVRPRRRRPPRPRPPAAPSPAASRPGPLSVTPEAVPTTEVAGEGPPPILAQPPASPPGNE